MFTFASLAEYEDYRLKSMQDPECQAAFKYAEETRCIISYERSFFRPVLLAPRSPVVPTRYVRDSSSGAHYVTNRLDHEFGPVEMDRMSAVFSND